MYCSEPSMYTLSGINNSETLSQFSLQFLPLAFILKFHFSLSLLWGLPFSAQGSQVKHFYLLLLSSGSTFNFLSSSSFCVLFCSAMTLRGVGRDWHLYRVWKSFKHKSISFSVRFLANSFPIRSSCFALAVSATGYILDLKNIYTERRALAVKEISEIWIGLFRVLLDSGLWIIRQFMGTSLATISQSKGLGSHCDLNISTFFLCIHSPRSQSRLPFRLCWCCSLRGMPRIRLSSGMG